MRIRKNAATPAAKMGTSGHGVCKNAATPAIGYRIRKNGDIRLWVIPRSGIHSTTGCPHFCPLQVKWFRMFEAWSERLSRNYQESVLTGFSGFEWESNRTVIHRFVRDNFRRVEIRYSLAVETLPNSYRLTFSADPDSPAPQFPVPQITQDGDTLALNLYVDAATGQKLVDYIHVLYRTPLHLRKEPARDSYSDDAEFAISQPRLSANGLALESGPIPAALHGQTLSVYIPGHGSYVLSLKPHPGYELAGEVSGNSLTFASAGNLFGIECPDRIASAGSATYNLYVLRDPAAEPPPDPARFLITAPGW